MTYYSIVRKEFVVIWCILETMKGLKYKRGNQNPSIEEGQRTQWPKEKGQKD